MATTTWSDALGKEKNKDYFQNIMRQLQDLRTHTTVYPDPSLVFNALRLTELQSVKAVLLGQDPYHGPNQAHGLCFSVPEGTQAPPSLRNIQKALKYDLGLNVPQQKTDLTPWAQQGVLLLNTSLTVEQGKAGSHSSLGWQRFTNTIIQTLAALERPLVFLLWGRHAHSKECLIHHKHHLVLKAPHPSPLSAHRGFLTCKHFSKTNAWLTQHATTTIAWEL